MKHLQRLLGALTLWSLLGAVPAAARDGPECIAPAKPGGGFDLTCKLARAALNGKYLGGPLQLSYMPGGVGAVAFNVVVTQRPAERHTLVAFSEGTLLNLAQGKFGRHDASEVRWVAGIALDHGVLMVAQDSPIESIQDLLTALKADPAQIVFGAGGTIGSQAWMKVALTARAAGLDHRKMRFVAFEGGGEAMTALQDGHVQVYSGDAAEALAQIRIGKRIRILAVMAEQRLQGVLADVPTAKEQGLDIVWPIVRGFYIGPQVSDGDYHHWVATFTEMLATPEFARLREQRGLDPFAKTGAELDTYVRQRVATYRELARQFGLKVAAPH